MKILRRVTALLLAVIMTVSLLPENTFAAAASLVRHSRIRNAPAAEEEYARVVVIPPDGVNMTYKYVSILDPESDEELGEIRYNSEEDAFLIPKSIFRGGTLRFCISFFVSVNSEEYMYLLLKTAGYAPEISLNYGDAVETTLSLNSGEETVSAFYIQLANKFDWLSSGTIRDNALQHVFLSLGEPYTFWARTEHYFIKSSVAGGASAADFTPSMEAAVPLKINAVSKLAENDKWAIGLRLPGYPYSGYSLGWFEPSMDTVKLSPGRYDIDIAIYDNVYTPESGEEKYFTTIHHISGLDPSEGPVDFDPSVLCTELLSPSEVSIWPGESVVNRVLLHDDKGYPVACGEDAWSYYFPFEKRWSYWSGTANGESLDFYSYTDSDEGQILIFDLDNVQAGTDVLAEIEPEVPADDGLFSYQVTPFRVNVHVALDHSLKVNGATVYGSGFSMHEGRQVEVPYNENMGVYDLRALTEGDPVLIPVINTDYRAMDFIRLTVSSDVSEVTYSPSTDRFVLPNITWDGEALDPDKEGYLLGVETSSGTMFLPMTPAAPIPAGEYVLGGIVYDGCATIFGKRVSLTGEAVDISTENYAYMMLRCNNGNWNYYYYPTVLGQPISLPAYYSKTSWNGIFLADPDTVDEFLVGVAYYFENVISSTEQAAGPDRGPDNTRDSDAEPQNEYNPEYIMLYDIPVATGEYNVVWQNLSSFSVSAPKAEYTPNEPVVLDVQAIAGGNRLAKILKYYYTESFLPLSVNLTNLSTGAVRALESEDWRTINLGKLPAGQYRAEISFTPEPDFIVGSQAASVSFLVSGDAQEHTVYLTGPESAYGPSEITVHGLPGASVTLRGTDPDGNELAPQTAVLGQNGKSVFTVELTENGYYIFTADSTYAGETITSAPFRVFCDLRVPADVLLTAEAEGSMSVRLRWEDREAFVSKLYIYRDGNEIADLQGSARSYLDMKLPEEKEYTYYVIAEAANGLRSEPAEVTCTPVYVPDIEPPSTPRSLSGKPSGTRIKLTWARSSDNESIAGYLVYRDGEEIASVTDARTYEDYGLIPEHTYTYAVAAFDEAGNRSGFREAEISTLGSESIEEIVLKTDQNTEGAILGDSLKLTVYTGEGVAEVQAEIRYTDGEEKTLVLPLTEYYGGWSADWEFPEDIVTLLDISVKAFDHDGVQLAAKIQELMWPRAQNLEVSLLLPNAAYARGFLRDRGVLTLAKTGTMESYRQSITQKEDEGSYVFENVTPGDYVLILTLKGNQVLTQEVTVSSEETNEISLDASDAGLIRVKYEGPMTHWPLSDSSGTGYRPSEYSLTDEGYLKAPNGDTAFFWSGETAELRAVSKVFISDDAWYELENLEIPMASVRGNGGEYAVPAPEKKGGVRNVSVTLSAGEASLANCYFEVETDNGLKMQFGTQESNVLQMALPDSTKSISFKLNYSSLSGDIYLEAKTYQLALQGGVDSYTLPLSVIRPRTVNLHFTADTGESLQGAEGSLYWVSNGHSYSRPFTLNADNRAVVTGFKAPSGAEFEVMLYSKFLPTFNQIKPNTRFRFHGDALDASVVLKTNTPRFYNLQFVSERGDSLEGVEISFFDQGTLKDTKCTLDADGRCQLQGINLSWHVKGKWLDEAQSVYLCSQEGNLEGVPAEQQNNAPTEVVKILTRAKKTYSLHFVSPQGDDLTGVRVSFYDRSTGDGSSCVLDGTGYAETIGVNVEWTIEKGWLNEQHTAAIARQTGKPEGSEHPGAEREVCKVYCQKRLPVSLPEVPEGWKYSILCYVRKGDSYEYVDVSKMDDACYLPGDTLPEVQWARQDVVMVPLTWTDNVLNNYYSYWTQWKKKPLEFWPESLRISADLSRVDMDPVSAPEFVNETIRATDIVGTEIPGSYKICVSRGGEFLMVLRAAGSYIPVYDEFEYFVAWSDDTQRGTVLPEVRFPFIPENGETSVVLPFQQDYYITVLGPDGEPYPYMGRPYQYSNEGSEKVCPVYVQTFDENHKLMTYWNGSQQFITDWSSSSRGNVLHIQLTNPKYWISEPGKQLTVFLALDGSIDPNIGRNYEFWDSVGEAACCDFTADQGSGPVTISLYNPIYRISRAEGSTQISTVNLVSPDEVLVCLKQEAVSRYTTDIYLPDGAYNIRVDGQSGNPKVTIPSGGSETGISFHISMEDLEKDPYINGYIQVDRDDPTNTVWQFAHEIPYKLLDISMRSSLSSSEITFQNPEKGNGQKPEHFNVVLSPNMKTTGGADWGTYSLINGMTNGVSRHYHTEEEMAGYTVETYRAENSANQEGLWLAFDTIVKDFSAALEVDGIPVEIREVKAPLTVSTGHGYSTSGSGGSWRYKTADTTSSHAAGLPTGYETGEDGRQHYWMSVTNLEAMSLEENGHYFLYVPIPEPDGWPGRSEVDLHLKYKDSHGEIHVISEKCYVIIHKDAAVLEKWNYTHIVPGFEKESTYSEMNYRNIRTIEDRKDYMEQKENAKAKTVLYWNGIADTVFEFNAWFDKPDEIAHVFAVADLPEYCENYYFELLYDEEKGCFTGTGMLGDELNAPKEFGVNYILKADLAEEENIYALELNDLLANSADDIREELLSEGWTIKEIAPMNGQTLAECYAVWDRYKEAVKDGSLTDTEIASLFDKDGYLYLPAYEVYNPSGELYTTVQQFYCKDDLIEDPGRTYSRFRIRDKGVVLGDIEQSIASDEEENIVMLYDVSDHPELLLPYPVQRTTSGSGGNSVYSEKLSDRSENTLRVPKRNKWEKFGKATWFVLNREVDAISAHRVNEFTKNTTPIGQLPDWYSDLPDDAKMAYKDMRLGRDLVEGVELFSFLIPNPLVSMGEMMFEDLVIKRYFDDRESYFRDLARRNKPKAPSEGEWVLQIWDDGIAWDENGRMYNRKLKVWVNLETGEMIILTDPSGYIFEGTEENRVEGVTATVYYQDSKTKEWLPWDSEDYGEGPNPKISTEFGDYGWNVMEGKWKVIFEKDGMYLAESEELDVPPAHTDVNISMVSTLPAAPEAVKGHVDSVEFSFDRPVLLETMEGRVKVVVNGFITEGTIEPLDAAETAGGNKQAESDHDTEPGQMAARRFRITPDEEDGLLPDDEVIIELQTGILTYNGLNVGETAFDPVTIPETEEDPIQGLRYKGPAELEAGETLNLLENLEYSGTEGDITVTALNPEIASCAGGVITAVAPGNAIFLVRSGEETISVVILVPGNANEAEEFEEQILAAIKELMTYVNPDDYPELAEEIRKIIEQGILEIKDAKSYAEVLTALENAKKAIEDLIHPSALVNPFVDVKEGKFYYEPVLWAYYHVPQITTGTDPTHFSPNASCKRSEVVTFLWRLYGCESGAPNAGFKDVKAGKWYSEAVNWAAAKEIVTGYKDASGNLTGIFGLNDECKREEVVTILWRAAGKPKAKTDSGFKDVKKNKWYTEAINWAAENGITTGLKDSQGNLTGEFGLGRTCTRGEIVTFLYRFANTEID